MNDYSKIFDSESLNLVEEKIEISRKYLVDINDIIYKYQVLFERIEILRAINVSTKLLLRSRNLKFNNKQREAALAYLSILENKDYRIDFHMFCELPRSKIMKNDPWGIMVEFKIYRDRVLKPAKRLYPDLKEYLSEKLLLNEVISQIDRKITILIPGKIRIAKEDISVSDKKIIL